jgi:hypothetical protein
MFLTRIISTPGHAAADLLSRLTRWMSWIVKNKCLAALSCYMLFKRKARLLGFYAGFVCGAIEPLILFFR